MPCPTMALIAASLPAPEPETSTSTSLKPCSLPFRVASSAARCAAKAVDLRDPLNPTVPELPQHITPPFKSVIVTMVLLNVDCI